MNMITLIPSIIVIFFGSKVAQRLGHKEGLIRVTKLSILFAFILLGVFLIFDPTQFGTAVLPTAAFLTVYSIYVGFRNLSANFVFPMIADCADYEWYKNGKNVPGIMGSIFSFVDKMVSSLSASIVGFTIAAIGYRDVMPQVGEASNPQIFWVSMLLLLGMPVLGWSASLLAMKFYPLDSEKMEEIQSVLEDMKAAAVGETA
jgi:Na+/melibiose symporter-like transporter